MIAAAIRHVTAEVDVNFLAWILGFVVPVVTAILTKSTAHPAIKAISTALLAAGAGCLAAAIKLNGHVDLNEWGVTIGQAMVMAWASYYGFWKPTTVAPSIHEATGRFGVG